MLTFEDKKTAGSIPRHLRASLTLAGYYNLLWGAAVISFPTAAFRIFQMELPRYPQIWQCVGMIVGVYGIGYLIASSDPYRHWPIVLVGLLGKVFGPVGFLVAASSGDLPWSWGLIILFNDLIWWLPFGQILYLAWRYHSDTGMGRPHDIDEATHLFPSQLGYSLAELSEERPVMIVFLRHFGCTFCREALSDLSAARKQIEELGFALALVHMSRSPAASALFKRYGLEGVHHFSDRECEIYRAFGLERGFAWQLFTPNLWWRAISATLRGHLVGKYAGDGFRMPGLFYLFDGEIWGSYRHRTSADRPDYLALSQQVYSILQTEELLA